MTGLHVCLQAVRLQQDSIRARCIANHGSLKAAHGTPLYPEFEMLKRKYPLRDRKLRADMLKSVR